MESKLHGIYRVSFDIEVESQDELALSDFAQALTEGFGENLVGKVANLDVKKLDKQGFIIPKILKAGDIIRLTEDIKINASIYSDDGYFFIGQPTDISEAVSEEHEIIISAGSIGLVNGVVNGKVEIVNMDKPLTHPDYISAGIDAVNVDFICIDANLVDKLDNEEDK